MKKLSALLLCAALLLPAAARAQDDGTQHLSAEEFLALDEPKPAQDPAPDAAVTTNENAAPASQGETLAAPEPSPFDTGAKRQMENRSIVRLRTIDKLSARTHTFEIPVGKTVKFGKSLFIKARACRSASQLDEPENAAFLQIWERQPTGDDGEEESSQWIFSGWMFSSSPSLSAMEHAIYDVWVIECKNDATVAASDAYSGEKAPAVAPEDAAPAVKTEAPAPAAAEAKKPAAAPTPAPAQMAPVAPVSGGSAAVPTLQELPGSFEGAEE